MKTSLQLSLSFLTAIIAWPMLMASLLSSTAILEPTARSYAQAPTTQRCQTAQALTDRACYEPWEDSDDMLEDIIDIK